MLLVGFRLFDSDGSRVEILDKLHLGGMVGSERACLCVSSLSHSFGLKLLIVVLTLLDFLLTGPTELANDRPECHVWDVSLVEKRVCEFHG